MCRLGRSSEGNTRASSKPFIRSAFEVLDFDKDGKISKEDLIKTLHPSAIEQNHEDVIKTMMGVADLNKDGFVEFEEFERVVGAVPKDDGRRRGIMEEAFGVMDKDGDGIVSFQDLKEFMGWAGFPVSEEDVVAMIRLASGMDRDRGVVTFDDLVRVLGL